MSELKDYDIMDIEAMDDERLEKSSSGKIFVTRVYIKSEVDAVLAEKDAEIRRLQRALWIARERRAWCEGQFWFAVESDKPKDIYLLLSTSRIHRTPNEWYNYWHEVERKCQAKAEEYK